MPAHHSSIIRIKPTSMAMRMTLVELALAGSITHGISAITTNSWSLLESTSTSQHPSQMRVLQT